MPSAESRLRAFDALSLPIEIFVEIHPDIVDVRAPRHRIIVQRTGIEIASGLEAWPFGEPVRFRPDEIAGFVYVPQAIGAAATGEILAVRPDGSRQIIAPQIAGPSFSDNLLGNDLTRLLNLAILARWHGAAARAAAAGLHIGQHDSDTAQPDGDPGAWPPPGGEKRDAFGALLPPVERFVYAVSAAYVELIARRAAQARSHIVLRIEQAETFTDLLGMKRHHEVYAAASIERFGFRTSDGQLVAQTTAGDAIDFARDFVPVQFVTFGSNAFDVVVYPELPGETPPEGTPDVWFVAAWLNFHARRLWGDAAERLARTGKAEV